MGASLVVQMVKHLAAMWKTWVWSLDQEDPLEKEMATHSSTLAWKIPWMEKPGGLQSMGSQRARHDWVTSLHFIVHVGEGNGNPFQYSCLENSMDWGAWWATVHGVAKSQTWLRTWLEWWSMRVCTPIPQEPRFQLLYHYLEPHFPLNDAKGTR